MEELPTFVTQDTMASLALWFGVCFPLVLIAGFFLMYNRVMERRTKEQREAQLNLTNLKGRSNGHHKHKVHE